MLIRTLNFFGSVLSLHATKRSSQRSFFILFDAGSSRRKINRLPDKREKLSCGEVTKFQMVLGKSPTWFRSKELLGSSFKQSSFSAVHCSLWKLIIVLFTCLWCLIGRESPWVLTCRNYPLKIKENFVISFHGGRISPQCLFSLHEICGKYQLYWMRRCFRRVMYLSFWQCCPVLTRQFAFVSTVLWAGVEFSHFCYLITFCKLQFI